ncbi:MAG: hypothetical protein ACI9DK_002432 [Vicingaceae bacterium]|jgi:hypothetical protein
MITGQMKFSLLLHKAKDYFKETSREIGQHYLIIIKYAVRSILTLL